MPLVKISVLRGRSADEKRALLEAVHRSVVEGLGVPEDDRTQLLSEHEAIEVPPWAGPAFTLVEVSMRPGRDVEIKERLYGRLRENLALVGVASSDLLISIHEVPLEDWGFPQEPEAR